jgi:hypothetical protein
MQRPTSSLCLSIFSTCRRRRVVRRMLCLSGTLRHLSDYPLIYYHPMSFPCPRSCLQPKKPISTVCGGAPTHTGPMIASLRAQTQTQRRVTVSPLKKTLRTINSLRPYTQSRGYHQSFSSSAYPNPNADSNVVSNATATSNAAAMATIIAKQITPWLALMQGLSPVKEKEKDVLSISASSNSRASPSSTATLRLKRRPHHQRDSQPLPHLWRLSNQATNVP